MRLTKGIANFGNGTVTIYPKLDPFLDSSREEEKIGDDWDLLLDDLDFGDIQDIEGVEFPPFVCKMGKNSKINLNALADTGFDINVMPYRVYKELGREEVTDVKRGITMLNHSKAEPIGLLKDVLCQAVLNPFRKVSVWKKVVSFLGSLPVPLQHVDWKPDYTRCFNKKEDNDGQWHAEIGLTDPYGNIFDQTMGAHDDEARSSRSKLSRQYEMVEEAMLLRVYHSFFALGRVCGEAIDEILTIKLSVAGTNEEIFTSEAWTNAFNIDDPIYSELCHEFYSTYEFDEVYGDDKLRTKKIIKFRLCRRAFSWTLLEFAKRSGLYNLEEIEEEEFDVYFQGGLRSDEHFNAQEYWLSISREENLSLSRSHASTIRNPVLRVLHKMITYGLCQRITGYDKMQKNDLWLMSMFEVRHQNGYVNVAWLIIAKRKNLLSEEVLNSLSALIYCRALDTTTLREFIDFEGRLIPEALELGVPRVAILRPPRASMQDLYERMGSMEMRHEVIERMSYRQSYHWDKYAGVFEHMVGVYSVPLQGAYNPPGYD
ncbi:hypothetical protein Tco_0278588 [Tanacetum coccineum]